MRIRRARDEARKAEAGDAVTPSSSAIDTQVSRSVNEFLLVSPTVPLRCTAIRRPELRCWPPAGTPWRVGTPATHECLAGLHGN